MLKTGHRTKYHLRAFEFLAARRRSRAVLTCTLLASFLATMPTGGLQAGDILRGGASAGNAKRNSEARANAGAAAAQAAKVRAQDRLARTTKAVNDMRALQASARAAAGANSIPNGLTAGGLKVLTGANAKWEGANAPTASGNTVNIKQTASQALLHWETFNVGSQTTVNFDQSAGGVDVSKWIAFNKVLGSTAPSQIRGKINAQGQVYIINQNGIIFGAGSQVNTRALVASALPINDNLIKNGLLNNKDAQFLFSSLEVPGGSDGTPTFTPTNVPDVLGDVVVERGAKISSPELAGGNGGRVMLVGANVRNNGEISTPAGQTILAAGLQVGVQAHNSGDPSLRGLDAWVGAVGDYAGTVSNSGLVEAKMGSILAVGKQITQSGILESSTSVNLNGRIDLLASYGAVANPNFDQSGKLSEGCSGPIFINQFTGNVLFAPDSLTRIVPDYDSTKSVPGIKLAQNSRLNVDANEISIGSGATIFLPSGNVRFRAGVWPYKDDASNNHTIFDSDGNFETGLDSLIFGDGSQRFFFQSGSVNLASGSTIDVSGTPDVFVPMDQHVKDIQLRGTELADSPLQRSQGIRGKTLTVDLRRSGTYGGRFWIGTPLGDATGLANVIERNVSQLTTRGGTVEITAGSAVKFESGSEVNVSGGYTQNEGGFSNTTRLLRDGRPIDISAATPDVVYDGILTDEFTESSTKWGVNEDYKKILLPLARYNERSYIEGASGGSVSLTAPSVQMAGNLIGNTITGPKQLFTPPGHSALALTFKNQKRIDTDSTSIFLDQMEKPPAIVFSNSSGASGLALAGRELSGAIAISPSLFSEAGGGFGFLSVDNTDGTILVPQGTPLTLPAGGSLAFKATNVEMLSSITVPGGSISATAYNYSPYFYAEQNLDPDFENQPAPAVVDGHGIIRVGSAVNLNTGGTLSDERATSLIVSNTRRVLDGGTVSLEGYSILMDPTSVIDASGGVAVNARGRFAKGNGGSISILAGKDPNLKTSAGGSLQLPGTLKAYSTSKGGSLKIQAPQILLTGKSGDKAVSSQGNRLVLSPDFFQQGGFTDYSIIGSGLADSMNPTIELAAGTTIHPMAATLGFSRSAYRNGRIALEPRLLSEGVRAPASMSLEASGFDDPLSRDKIESIGSIVVGAGSSIITDPLGKISLKGQTLSIHGRLEAPAGKITLSAAGSFPLSPEAAASNSNALTSLYLAPTARILARGTTILNPDPYGRRTGQVLNGGSISIKGNIVAEEGAVIDVSGATDQLDIHPSLLGSTLPTTGTGLSSKPWGQSAVRTQVDSNGGSITLQGSQMLFSDATLRGFAGGPTAIGGLLTVSSGAFSFSNGADSTLFVTQSGRVIAPLNKNLRVGSTVVDSEGSPIAGTGFFVASSFNNGGFDSLDLGYEKLPQTTGPAGGNIEFIGPVTISASGSIRLASGGVITANDKVVLNASRIALGQEFMPPLQPDEIVVPIPNMPINGDTQAPEPVRPTSGPGSLSISARLVDVGTTVLKNIGDLSIVAANGDIRGSGFLNVAGSVTLTAAQIYPVSLSKFEIFAYGEGSSVQINQSGTRALPLSAGGQLSIYAQNITNAGTLRAPFGSITLGWDGLDTKPTTEDIDPPGNLVAGNEDFPVTQNLVLRAGSTTSVSAIDPLTGQGIIVPFGVSPDGNSWIDPRGLNVTLAGMPEKKIHISADSINQEANSIIDLRGGGDLLAYRWISGPGGSADILGTPVNFDPLASYAAATLVSNNGKTYSSRMALDPVDFNGSLPAPGKTAYWLEIPESYAIIPGFQSEFAPHNPFRGSDPGYVSSTLKLGDQIVFDNNSALPAGSYTLLPRRYGLMPGAYLVSPISGGINTYTNAEGVVFASAYRSNAFSPTSIAPPLRSRFEILTPAVLANRVQYDTYRANTFIPMAAGLLRAVVTQPLPNDSANLAIQGNSALALRGNVLAQSSGGLGSDIDISSLSPITIGSSSAMGDGILLDASHLSSWGASSLLIGGLRRSSPTGTILDVKSESITLAGSLSGSDIILASKGALSLEVGASLSSQQSPAISSRKVSVAGQGAFVRVSSDAGADFARTSTEGENEPSLVVKDGASLTGAGVILDSTKLANISPLAAIAAQSVTLGGQKMIVDFDGTSTDSDALILGGNLLSYLSSAQSLKLNSYSSIDFHGSGTLGSSKLKSLVLTGGGISGTSAEVSLQAGSVSFSNPLASSVENVDLGSNLSILSQILNLGTGDFQLTGFKSASITATSGLIANASGKLISKGAVTIKTPDVAVNRLTNFEISAANKLQLNQSDSTSAVSSGLGATLSLIGSSVDVNTDITLPSGLLKIQASAGDVTIASKLSVDGSELTFFDTTRIADAGAIVLQADSGNIQLSKAATLSVKGATNGGKAGLIQLSAASGEFQNSGTLIGSAATGFDGGSFHLDVKQMTDFDSVNKPLEDGGFTNERIFRVRSGDVALNQDVKARTFELAADGGSITVSKKIDASGVTGGRIALSASGSLTLTDGALLTVAATDFNSAGKGGEIFLAAGSQLNGVVNYDATLNLETGSKLDLSVASYKSGNYDEPGSSAFEGKFQGLLHLRAPRTDSDIQISAIGSSIDGASAIIAEGYKIYDLTDEDTLAAISLTVNSDVTLSNGDIYSRTLEVGKLNTLLRDQINADNQAFLGTSDDSFASESALIATLLHGNPQAGSLAPLLVVAPGVEIISTAGDLTLGLANNQPGGIDDIEGTTAADWDLSTWRYGSKNAPGFLTLRAAGDILFNNALSDGFQSVASTESSGHSKLWLAQLQTINSDLPANFQSWSYMITAGADTNASSTSALLPPSALLEDSETGLKKGSVLVGEFYPVQPNPSYGGDFEDPAGVGADGTTANNLQMNFTEIEYPLIPDPDNEGEYIPDTENGKIKDMGTRYEVVRTGTGDIHVNAAGDVQLRNQFATIYTAGVAISDSSSVYSAGDFVVPVGLNLTPQWAFGGGDLKISAGRDIARVTQFTDSEGNTSIIPDSSHQMTSNWLYRRSHVDAATGKFGSIEADVTDESASTTWWIDYSNFFQGFGALGGGNVDLKAGRDVVNADAVAPTNARMAGRNADGENIAPSLAKLLEYGGGDVSVRAGRNIDGGLYYVERGQGLLDAGEAIKTNSSKSPSLGLFNRDPYVESDLADPEIYPESTWLPTTLFLGKGNFDVRAKNDVLLGPVANPFLMPVGLGNKSWYKTYFSTFSPESRVDATSLGGSVTFRTTAVMPYHLLGSSENIFGAWLTVQNLLTETTSTGSPAFFQPWARLVESEVNPFLSVLNLIPPTLHMSAFMGDLNVVGNLLLSPAPKGNLEMIAAGAIQGLQVAGKTEDYAQAWISSSINVSDANPSSIPSALNPLNSTSSFVYLDQALSESGSFTGANSLLDRKVLRHGNTLLHAGEPDPVRIYAKGGDFTGFNVFTPKQTRLFSGGDITDVSIYIQNVNSSDISIVSAAGNILPYNANSKLRAIATDTAQGHAVFDYPRQTASFKSDAALAGDIQASGPGIMEVIAGRNIDLGTGENSLDGTGIGITSIGNARNPNLPFAGAALVILSGLTGKDGGAALGLANSQLTLDGLKEIDSSVAPIISEFSTPEHEAIAGLQMLFALLQATGKNYPETASYEPGLTAVQKAFSAITGTGDIFTRSRDIRTVSGGSIVLAAPQGGLTMASDIYGNPLTPPGIVTEYGGSVSLLTDQNVDIGRARIFTLRGGDMTIWSTHGNIAAGTSPKTVVTAPPTRVLIDTPSADVATDLGGLATGGGIGVLASVEGVAPGDVYLLAPTGSVDAGDAGIQSTGNLNIAAVAVINADNISAAGTSVGVPSAAPAAAAPVAVSPGASSSTAATSSAAQNMAAQNQEQKEIEETPSTISVEVLGYGGGEGDGGKEEENEQAAQQSAML